MGGVGEEHENFRVELVIESAEQEFNAYVWKCPFMKQNLTSGYPVKYRKPH